MKDYVSNVLPEELTVKHIDLVASEKPSSYNDIIAAILEKRKVCRYPASRHRRHKGYRSPNDELHAQLGLVQRTFGELGIPHHNAV